MYATDAAVDPAFVPYLDRTAPDDGDGLHDLDAEPTIAAEEAARAYGAAGWYIIPTQATIHKGAADFKNPGSVFGKRWPQKSVRDAKMITAIWAGRDYGIALDLGRSGFVCIDVDKPELLPEWLQTELRRSDAPFQQTRPRVPGRGHYLFRQPPGQVIGCSRGGLEGCGLDIKGDGGVIILEPTRHPDGGQYRWTKTGAIPVLPDAIAEKLSDRGADREAAATDEEVEEFLDAYVGEDAPRFLTTWLNKYAEALRRGDSRHDTMVLYLPAALEEARIGQYPARRADEKLRAAFVESKTRNYKGKDPMTEEDADAEFEGILSWAVGQAKRHTVEELRAKFDGNIRRNEEWMFPPPQAPEDRTEDDRGEIPQAEDRNAAPWVAHVETILEAEQGFWTRRESLGLIFNAAAAQKCSPWGVLANCAARAGVGAAAYLLTRHRRKRLRQCGRRWFAELVWRRDCTVRGRQR